MCLDDDSAAVRRAAIVALARIVPRGDEQTVSALKESFHRPQQSIVKAALVEALGKVGHPDDESILETIIASISDDSMWVRREVYEALSNSIFAKYNAKAISALVHALHSEVRGQSLQDEKKTIKDTIARLL